MRSELHVFGLRDQIEKQMSRERFSSTRDQSPPGPSGTVSSGAASDPLRFLLGLSREYGDVVRYHTAYGETYLINHPDSVGRAFQNRNIVRGSLMKQTLGEIHHVLSQFEELPEGGVGGTGQKKD